MSEPSGTSKRTPGILWDLDGVLVNSGEAHYRAWAETCGKYAIPFSHEAFWRTFGMNNAGIVATLTGRVAAAELVTEISNYKEDLFRSIIRGTVQILPGVKLWLDRFHAAGLPQTVASSAPLANIYAVVDELGIRSFFSALVSGAEMPGKPDPSVFLEASLRIGIAPERCLVIEDSVAGVEGARRGKMKCLAITNTNPRPLLKEAHLIVDSLEELSWEDIDSVMLEGV